LSLILTPIPGIPLIEPGDDLAAIIFSAILKIGINIEDNDIFVVAQKIVSKAEGRLVHLSQVVATAEAESLAKEIEKDPRLVTLILCESNEVLRKRVGTIVVEHKRGFVCANAGIDHSNVRGKWGSEAEWVLLLPENPDGSARNIRDGLQMLSQKKLGVVIIDSHGRAWRMGTSGIAIGLAGVPGLVDLRGTPDLYGFRLKITQVAAADELAAAASLVMGQADEMLPVVHVRGFPYPLREAELSELIRPKDLDLFR
jgi:coenzyme F420-0:L-glutamate ligase / coenzyme F420-1:gamma-L-glutamate ligase